MAEAPEIIEGIVVEALPNTLFRVEPQGGGEPLLAYLAGKMRLHRIKVLVGDKVQLAARPLRRPSSHRKERIAILTIR
jgi:translation initiation factor IF-1